MAATVMRTASALKAPPSASFSTASNPSALSHNFSRVVSFTSGSRRRRTSSCLPARFRIHHRYSGPEAVLPVTRSSGKFLVFASDGEVADTAQTEPQVQEQVHEHVAEGNQDDNHSSDGLPNDVEATASEDISSTLIIALKSYREALANNDESRIAELEAFFKSIDDEKVQLEKKLLILTEELSNEKDRVIRISADFDNFRSELIGNDFLWLPMHKGEVVEKLLPVLDNFDRAKTQLKIETEGEEKINKSYQSISKQFMEIMGSLGVTPVETIGNAFDPLLHEAILREDSTEFDEGVIIEEFRKGFQLRERLLRPSMVKVSAGPGPAKSETSNPGEELKEVTEAGDESDSQQEDTNETG